MQDLPFFEDDELIGIKSTARLFGTDTARWLKYFLIGTVSLMAFAIIDAALPGTSVLALAVALGGPWAMGWHMALQLARFDPDDGPGLVTLFRSNRNAGLFPVLFFAAAAWL